MPNIITRYLTREIFKTSAATLLILFIILMSNALGRVLADIADGDIPQQALMPVLLSQSVNILSLLVPIAYFLGIIFAFGRLYSDHEIVVMNACGMSYRHFYKPVLIILIPLGIFSAYASLSLNSQMQRNAKSIVDLAEDVVEFEQIKAGQFNPSNNGDHVFFMESMSDDRRELNNVIISQSNSDTMILEIADKGRYKKDETTGDLFLVVGPGKRYEGRAGSKDFKTIKFERHGILIEKKIKQSGSDSRREEMTFGELWLSPDLDNRVELLWRISVPVLLIILAFLAVPLSYLAPRKGRFGKVGLALIVYIIYLNLMVFTKAKLEAGTFPLTLNFWWIHGIFILLTISLINYRNHGQLFFKGVKKL